MSSFFSLIKNPIKFRLFLLKNLPSAYFSGVRVVHANEETCKVSVPYKWFSRNPFRSTYFACLSMAAEMSTGILAMANVYKKDPKVALLVVAIEGKFFKKATGKTEFICKQGLEIKETVNKAVSTNTPQTISALSSGYNDNNELVAEFVITWSFKSRST